MARSNEFFKLPGGVHDMAAWTSKIWNETVHMLEHGTSQCNMGRSTMHVNCTGYLPQQMKQSDDEKPNLGRGSTIRSGAWNTSHVVKTRTIRGVTFTPGQEMEKVIQRLHDNKHQNEDGVQTTAHSYSQIGRFV